MSRESPSTSFVLSLILHALVFAAIVTGVATPAGWSKRAAALGRTPETVNVQLVELPPGRVAKPAEPTTLAAGRESRAADRGPRDLPEGAAYSEGRTSLPSPTAGEGGRAAGPRARPAPPTAAAGRTQRAGQASAPPRGPAAAAAGARGEREAREEQSAGVGELAAAGNRAGSPSATGTRAGSTGAAPGALGDPRLQPPRPEISAPPLAGPPGTGARGLPQVDNRLTRARYEGDFSLNTYAWEYAPYMSRLKRQIEDYTWTILPAAFWYGIAAWATQVRFVILPDGQLQSVTISGHEGVVDLRHVAPDAVSGAADFEPLPPGFPEPELVVTGNFYFNVFPPGRSGGEDGESP